LDAATESWSVSARSPDTADTELRAVVSLLVAPDRRESGVARATVDALRDYFPQVVEFIAYVHPANEPSLAMLKSFGWVGVGIVDDNETFVWRRDGSPPAADWKAPVFRWWRS
jgi:RimJ/RimL family protein N-acetyltransferase